MIKMVILFTLILTLLIGCSKENQVTSKIEALGFCYEKKAPKTVIKNDSYNITDKIE